MEGGSLKEMMFVVWNYFWFILIAVLGGTANYLGRIKGKGLPFSLAELIGEWFISGFAGIVTVNLCLEHGLSIHITAAAAGIAGHMGGRGIYILENIFLSQVKRWLKRSETDR